MLLEALENEAVRRPRPSPRLPHRPLSSARRQRDLAACTESTEPGSGWRSSGPSRRDRRRARACSPTGAWTCSGTGARSVVAGAGHPRPGVPAGARFDDDRPAVRARASRRGCSASRPTTLTDQRVPLDAVWAADRVRRVTDLLAASRAPGRGRWRRSRSTGAPRADDDAALIDDVVALARAGSATARRSRTGSGSAPGSSSVAAPPRSATATKTLHRILRLQHALDARPRRRRAPADSAGAGRLRRPGPPRP